MKIVFAGTPDFASTALDALIKAGHEIPLVLTQPDRPAGRGMKLQPSAVKKLAVASGIPVEQPVSLRTNGAHAEEAKRVHDLIESISPDVMVVVAYGLILPKLFLDLPKYGCLNIHASLLPRWRGAAPIQRAIEFGDKQSGVSIMQMEEGLDTGPVLLSEAIDIGPAMTTAELHDSLAELGGRLIRATLDDLPHLLETALVQDNAMAIYAEKIRKEEAGLDFTLSSTELANRIRAFNPFPGCTTTYQGTQIKIWRAIEEVASGAPGQILSSDETGIVVACGKGAIRILELQKPGAKRLPAAEFVKGFTFDHGHFG